MLPWPVTIAVKLGVALIVEFILSTILGKQDLIIAPFVVLSHYLVIAPFVVLSHYLVIVPFVVLSHLVIAPFVVLSHSLCH